MASVPNYYVTPEEYLALERKAEFKSEYIDGVIYALAGGAKRHSLLATSIIISLVGQLRDRPCTVYNSDLKVTTPKLQRYFYPDVSVVCGATGVLDDQEDVILNPILIVEVLSESTAAYDRGKKFLSYQQIDSLQEYILVSQDEVLVEGHARQGNDTWLYTKVTGMEGSLTLPLIAS